MRWIFKSFINTSTLLLMLRLIAGIVFFMHGAQKLFGWFGGSGLEATIMNFGTKMGIPPFLAYMDALAEFIGGISLLSGFMTRFFSLGLVVVMAVAIFKVHIANGFFNPGGIEYPLTLLIINLGILLMGSGSYSLDEFIARKYRRVHISEDGRFRTEYKTHYKS